MLKITISGEPLDLPKDIALSLIFENPMFVTDRIPTAHSVSSSLPPTDRNLRLLGHPERINRKNRLREFEGIRVYFDSVMFLKGVLVMTEFDQDIKFFIRGAIFSEEMKAPINEADMDTYSFGSVGNRFTPNFYLAGDFGYLYREYVHDTLTGSSDTRFAPIRIKGVEFPDGNSPTPTGYGNYATSIMYFNFWNAYREEFMLGYPSFQAHTVCFPFLSVKYLVSEIFDSSLINNPFTASELSKLVITSTYHPRFSDVVLSAYRGVLLDSSELDASQFLNLESFTTSMNFNVLIKQILKMFCMTLFIKADEFEFKYNRDIMEESSKIDWSQKLVGDLASWTEDGEEYSYGYQGYQSVEKPYGISEVDNIEDLAALTVPEGEEKQVWVTNTNQMFDLRKRFEDEGSSYGGISPEYEFETEVLDPGFAAAPNTPSSGFNMVSDVTPLPVNIHPYWWENTGSPIKFGRWYVPEWEGDRLQRPAIPNVMMFRGLVDTLTDKDGESPPVKDLYPYLSSHNIDAYGNNLGDISLHWEGADGLITNYHSEFKSWIESEKLKARGAFLLTALDLKNLDMSSRHHVTGVDFFIEKVEVTLFANKIEKARVHLVEAPYLGSASGGL